MIVGEQLYLFIGHVDADLLKAVVLKVLEAEDVEDANIDVVVGLVFRRLDELIDSIDNPAKKAAIQGLGQGVTTVLRLGNTSLLLYLFTYEK